MTPTTLSLVILGFAVTCAVEMSNVTIGGEQNTTSSEDDATDLPPTPSNIESKGAEISTIDTALIITTMNTTSIPSTNSTNSATNQTSTTSNSSTTLRADKQNPITPKPGVTSKSPPTNTKDKKDTGPGTSEESNNSTGLIVLIVILILAAVFVAACCWTRRRGRRYSVDPTSQADGVNIPLSSVEPTDPPASPVPHNGLQTFAESASNEPEVKPEVQEEQKAEADKPAVEPGAESAPPAPDSSEDKPEGAAAERGPPAPVEPEGPGGEGPAPAEESVTEANENNSNNGGLTARDFWDVPLHSPV